MSVEGNHEIETLFLNFPPPFTAYNARFPMPYKESGSDSNLYYSFDVAGAHVLMLGSYAPFLPGTPQYKWLEVRLRELACFRAIATFGYMKLRKLVVGIECPSLW
jgi:hypothetical protein